MSSASLKSLFYHLIILCVALLQIKEMNTNLESQTKRPTKSLHWPYAWLTFTIFQWFFPALGCLLLKCSIQLSLLHYLHFWGHLSEDNHMQLLLNMYRNKLSDGTFNNTHLEQIWTRCFSVWNHSENWCYVFMKSFTSTWLILVWITHCVYTIGQVTLASSPVRLSLICINTFYSLSPPTGSCYGLISTLVYFCLS